MKLGQWVVLFDLADFVVSQFFCGERKALSVIEDPTWVEELLESRCSFLCPFSQSANHRPISWHGMPHISHRMMTSKTVWIGSLNVHLLSTRWKKRKMISAAKLLTSLISTSCFPASAKRSFATSVLKYGEIAAIVSRLTSRSVMHLSEVSTLSGFLA